MHLSTQLPETSEGPFAWDLYQAAIGLLSQLEACNVISLRLLPSALLIGLFEISNAIYPSPELAKPLTSSPKSSVI